MGRHLASQLHALGLDDPSQVQEIVLLVLRRNDRAEHRGVEGIRDHHVVPGIATGLVGLAQVEVHPGMAFVDAIVGEDIGVTDARLDDVLVQPRDGTGLDASPGDADDGIPVFLATLDDGSSRPVLEDGHVALVDPILRDFIELRPLACPVQLLPHRPWPDVDMLGTKGLGSFGAEMNDLVPPLMHHLAQVPDLAGIGAGRESVFPARVQGHGVGQSDDDDLHGIAFYPNG